MTHPRGCADRREAVAALVMGALLAEEAADVQGHLACCEECRRLHESLRRQEADVLWAFERIGSDARNSVPCSAPPAPARHRSRWALRGVMSPRVAIKTAIAAAVLAGAIGVWVLSHQSGRQAEPSFAILAQPVYAVVLQEIDKARSVRYTRQYLEEGRPPWVGQQTVREGGRIRTVMSNGMVMINNLSSGETMTLHPRQKFAYRAIQTPSRQPRFLNMADWIKTLHEHKGMFSGQELLDGTLTNVYKVDEPYEKITIWAHAWTHLPVRFERVLLPCTDKDIRIPRVDLQASDFTDDADEKKRLDHSPDLSITVGFKGTGMHEAKATIILTDFAWNGDYDDSLFSLTPPDGYEVHVRATRYDAPADESSLVKALRFWAETSDGRFPENIGMLADCKPNLIRKYRPVGSPEEAFKQAAPMLDTVLGGLTFAQELKVRDNWHYAGKDVVLGEAGKPLCWWQPEGSDTFRVICGDLSMRDVPAPPENLPHSAAEAPTPP